MSDITVEPVETFTWTEFGMRQGSPVAGYSEEGRWVKREDHELALQSLAAPRAAEPAETMQHTLRAMASNYPEGPIIWDHLDKKACTQGADEIKSLKAALTQALAEVERLTRERDDHIVIATEAQNAAIAAEARATAAEAAVEIIREEAAKSNAPLGRSDSSALDRIRTFLSTLPEAASPPPPMDAGVTVTDALVAAAMQDAWNDICSDTGCHPDDISHGKSDWLDFAPRHWARATAEYLTAALSARGD